MNRTIWPGLVIAILATGCASKDPVELYRVVSSADTKHHFVVPSSLRDAGREKIIQTQLRFSEVQPGSIAAAQNVRAMQAVYAFDCHARSFRELSIVVTFNDGKTSREPIKPGRDDVLPESPREAMMGFACSSAVARLWTALRNDPQIHRDPSS